jgi:hypothetical protein
MGINRFSRPQQLAGYDAMSFQELSVAPIQMRKREDEALNNRDLMLHELNNLEYHEKYQGEAAAEAERLRKDLDAQAEKIMQNGIGGNTDGLRNLRNRYNTAVSKNGVLGKAAGLQQNIAAQKAAFFKAGLAAEQPPGVLEEQWKKREAAYYAQLPEELSKHDGALPAFEPGLPPKHYDFMSFAVKAAPLIGNIEETYGEVVQEPVYNDHGDLVDIKVYDKNNVDISNEQGIAGLRELMLGELLNPNSAMRQDMDFKGMSIEDAEAKIAQIGDMMLKKVDRESSKPRGNSTSTSRSTSSKSTQPKPGTQTTLTALDGVGKFEVDNTSTIGEIDQEIKAIQSGEVLIKSPEEKERKLDMLRQARRHRERTLSSFEQDNPKEYANQMTEYIQDNETFQQLGISSYEEYQAAKQDPSLFGNLEVMADPTNPHNRQTVSAQEKLGMAAGAIAQLKDKFLQENKGDVRLNAEMYTFGPDATGIKMQKMLSDSLNSNRAIIHSMINQGAVELSNGNIKHPEYGILDPEDSAEFLSLVENSENKFNFTGMTSGSNGADPSLMFTLDIKDGGKREFSIDLRDNEFTHSLLRQGGDFYESLDPVGKNRLDVIRDNIVYKGLATGFDTNLGSDFSENKTSNIKHYAAKTDENQQILNAIQNKTSPTGVEKLLDDKLFFKPYDTEHEYNVAVNRDSSYSSYKKNKETGEIEQYTFGDYLDKRRAVGVVKKYNSTTADLYNENYFDTEAAQEEKAASAYNLMRTILATTGDISTPKSMQNAIIYNSDKKFYDAMQQAHSIINNLGKPLHERRAEVLKIYESIEHLPLQSKRKHVVL